jgi:DNA polymerase-3 subunit delta'
VEYFNYLEIQQKIKNRLINSINNDRLSHAYIFYGPEGVGKEYIALEFAKAINCVDNKNRPCNNCSSCLKINQFNHPDIKFIFPYAKTWSLEDIRQRIKAKVENPFSTIALSGNTLIPIDQIRELKNESKYTPYEAEKKFYIISNADKLSRESTNAFLKLLEEPPSTLIIILVTSSLATLATTIRSRCQLIYFPRLSYEEAITVVSKYNMIDDRISQIVRLAEKNLKIIFDTLDKDIIEKRQIVYGYLKAIASRNTLKILEITDLITKKFDKNFLKEILNLLIFWFIDTLHLMSKGNKAEIVNVDFEKEINNFAQSYRDSDFEKIIVDIEQAILNINRNVYNPLILTVLAIRIGRNLVKKNI